MVISQNGLITVVGGSGFLGSEIVRKLSANGVRTRVAVRRPDAPVDYGSSRSAAKIEKIYVDVRDETSLALALKGSDAVVNTVSLYIEKARVETFEMVHELGAVNVAHQTVKLGINRLVHISGIGADQYSDSAYIRSRGKGEMLVSEIAPGATILRPSVLFGPNDLFLNTIARLIRYLPVLPLFGQGETRMQPVYVCDVASAVIKALEQEESQGLTYELGGPSTYSYRELLELIMRHCGKKPLLVSVPFPIWESVAKVLTISPWQPITQAQVSLMKLDNLVGKNARTFKDLNISPTPLEDILPQYEF